MGGATSNGEEMWMSYKEWSGGGRRNKDLEIEGGAWSSGELKGGVER